MKSRYSRHRRKTPSNVFKGIGDSEDKKKRYNSLEEVRFRTANLRKKSPKPRERKPIKSTHEYNTMKRSLSNFQSQAQQEKRKRKRKRSSNRNFQSGASRYSSIKKRDLSGDLFPSNYSLKKNRKRNYSEIEASLNYLSSVTNKKYQKKSNLKKEDLLSKYFRGKGRKSRSRGERDYYDKSLGLKQIQSKIRTNDLDYASSSLINRTLDRNNLKDSILRKYRTSENNRDHKGKSSELYKNYMKKKIISNALEKHHSDYFREMKKKTRHKKSKTLSHFPQREGNSSSIYLKTEEKFRPKRVNSGYIHHQNQEEGREEEAVNKYRSKRRKSSNTKKRKKRGRSLGASLENAYYSTSALYQKDNNPSKSQKPKKEARKRSRKKAKKPSKSQTRKQGESLLRQVSSKSIHEIKIAEFESTRGAGRNKGRIKHNPYPHLDSIKKNYYKLPPFEKSKVIVKKFGKVHSFSVNTHQGTVRNYNEDRVSILLNAQQRFESLISKGIDQCSMFAVYDGHGGERCCNYLKENLHTFIFQNFDPFKVKESIKRSCNVMDETFMQKAWKDNSCDTSGSCALGLITIDSKLIFVNVGDSRAILSSKFGKELQICTYDHKPHFFGEMQRILKKKGQLYRVCSNQKTQETEIYYANTREEFLEIERIPEETHGRIFGPWRVKPGGLSVSKTFGDIESKKPDLGGIRGVIVAEPEITIFNYKEDMDYALLGCDGIFDVLTNEEVNEVIWETVRFHKERFLKEGKKAMSERLAVCLNDCVNNVLKRSLIQNSEDNVTVILVAFRNLFECD